MKRALALGLCLLCLTSCARMLEREYTEATDHVEDQPGPGIAAYLVETYPALRAAVLGYVEEGMERGELRCPTTYSGNLSVDLEKARRQVLEEDPVGSYALEDVTFRISRIIAYYEVELEFTYREDTREVANLPRVATREALTQLLGQRLEGLESRVCVYLTAYPEEEPGFWESVLAETYDAFPAVLGRPQVTAQLYPQTGTRRVAVLELDYGEDTAELARRQARLEEAVETFWSGEGRPDAQGLFEALRARCRVSSHAGATAYDALVDGRADAQGAALAYAALCRRWGIECRVVWDGESCCAALRLEPEGPEVYLELSDETFAPVETLPSAAGGETG